MIAVLVGVTALQGWGPFARARHPRVVVLGDSLTAQSSWSISRALSATGFDPAVAGVNGAAIADMDAQVKSYTGYSGADVMVIALGTNNAFFAAGGAPRDISLEQTKKDLGALVGEALDPKPDTPFPPSVKCLVWVTVNDRAQTLELDKHAPEVNQAIRDEAAAQGRAGKHMLVADWTSRSQSHPEWFVSDGVHLTEVGQEAYGELIREAVERCPL